MKYINSIFILVIVLIFSSCSEEKIDGSNEVYGTITGKVVSSDSFIPIENVKVFSSKQYELIQILNKDSRDAYSYFNPKS